MGPNRQRRPDTERKGGRGATRHVRTHKHTAAAAPVSGMMSADSRNMIIDVLHHVASAGKVSVSEKHFDPNYSNKITFIKNSGGPSSAVTALVNVFSDAKPNGFGFHKALVELFVSEVVQQHGPSLSESIKCTSDVFVPSMADLVTNSLWELFSFMVWSQREEGSEEATIRAVECLTNEQLDEQDEAAWEEVEMLENIFDGSVVAKRGFSTDIGDDEAREVFLVFPTQDEVNVVCTIRIPEAYPVEFPLVRLHPKEGATADMGVVTQQSLLRLGSAARRTALEAAAEVIVHSEGSPCLVQLCSALQGALSEVKGIVELAKEAPSTSSQEVRDQKKDEAAAEKQRKQFLQTLTSGGANAGTASVVAEPAQGKGNRKSANPVPQKVAQKVDDDEDDGRDNFVMPKKLELATVDTAKTVQDLERTEFFAQKRDVDEALFDEWATLRRNGKLQSTRNSLPALAVRETLRDALRKHNVVVVGGETGSGKTTQVPQYLFEFMCEERKGSICNIVCTQPRRLAATAVALRVAEERDEDIGGTVGYSIRLENKLSARTRLLYCTTGIVLRRLQTDKYLGKVSHIVVDEIHERGIDTDFLLILLKDLLQRRNDLKVVLMSATMNSELFSHYFGGAPVISIAGRTFPVQVIHLERIISMVQYIIEDNSPFAKGSGPYHAKKRKGGAAPATMRNKNLKLLEMGGSDEVDYDALDEDEAKKLKESLVAADPSNASIDYNTLSTLSRMNLDVLNYEVIEHVITYICRHYSFEGAILVFLPGMAEIQKCFEELKSSPFLAQCCTIHNLHSSLESKDQHAIFRRAPRGKRKVVLGTNIMETSITIDDAVFVIDTGKHKENQYDARRSLSKLVTCNVSKANCRQRQGRAGRVREGICFRLFTSAQFALFDDHQLCEMHRVPLESLVLQIFTLNLGDEMEYLSKALSPPEEKAVKASVKVLTNLGALTVEKRLTSLGQHLANLPLDVKIGKMIIHGAVLHCLDPVLTIAACLSVRSPFLAGADDQPEVEAVKRAYAVGSASDSLANWYVYLKWISIAVAEPTGAASKQFCRDNYISLPTLLQIQATKRQYERYLTEAGFLTFSAQESRPAHSHRGSSHNHFLVEPYRTLDDQVFESGGLKYNTNSIVSKIIVACLMAGLYPNVAKISQKKPQAVGSSGSGRPQSNLRICTFDGSEVIIHPSSVAGRESNFTFPLLLYTDKVQTSMTFIREVTVVSPLHVILFGSCRSMEYKAAFGELVVDDVTAFKCTEQESVLLINLKEQFDSALRAKINEPTTVWESVSSNVVRAIVRLLREEGTTHKAMVVVVNPGQVTVAQQQQAALQAQQQQAPPAAAPEAPAVPRHLRNKTCFNCGETGHVSRMCPNPGPPKERGGPTVKCFVCGQWHHPSGCPHTKGGAAGGAKSNEAAQV